jgi:hypothetical protein
MLRLADKSHPINNFCQIHPFMDPERLLLILTHFNTRSVTELLRRMA